MDGWFHRTLAALPMATRKTEKMGRQGFLYLRIFYNGRRLGWNFEESPYYVCIIISMITAQLMVICLLWWRFPTLKKTAPITLVLLIYGVCTLIVIGLFFAAGRSCMMPKRPGVSLMHRYGCCGQGLVFPQEQVNKHLLPMYRNSNDSHAAVDTFLEDWANARDQLRWAVTPVLIQHVGVKSSHGAGDHKFGQLTDDMPFDYDFELNGPVDLAKEHQLWIGTLMNELSEGRETS
ncbi:hypothetical protein SCUP515_08202 [Seiridium cupressi]